jgi:hypothetical protein
VFLCIVFVIMPWNLVKSWFVAKPDKFRVGIRDFYGKGVNQASGLLSQAFWLHLGQQELACRQAPPYSTRQTFEMAQGVM